MMMIIIIIIMTIVFKCICKDFINYVWGQSANRERRQHPWYRADGIVDAKQNAGISEINSIIWKVDQQFTISGLSHHDVLI